MIVRKGDPIDPAHARIIAQMQGERQLRRQIPPLAATLALLALIAAVVWFAERHDRVAEPRAAAGCSRRACCCCSSPCWGRSSASWSPTPSRSPSTSAPLNSAHSYAYAIPFASVALVAMLLFGRNIGAAAVGALLAARRPPDRRRRGALDRLLQPRRLAGRDLHPRLLPVPPPAGDGARGAGGRRHQRDDGADPDRASPPPARGPMQVGFDLVCAFAGGLLVTAVASFAMPILEWALGITTDIKLVELSNTNLPLLRRLAFEAPGTFQHSLMVANLAKEGCEAIGADPVLAYTGGPLPRRRQGAAPRLLHREPAPRPQPARQAPALDERADPDQPRQGRRRAGARAQPAAGDRGRHRAAPRHAADQVLLQQGAGAERPRRRRRSPRRSTAIPAPSRRAR